MLLKYKPLSNARAALKLKTFSLSLLGVTWGACSCCYNVVYLYLLAVMYSNHKQSLINYTD